MSRLLYTTGDSMFHEKEWTPPELGSTEIRVKSIMTGVCRSDVDMMTGKFQLLPETMSGHEGLAQVVSVGASVHDVAPGHFVATRGEPAYADYYNVKYGSYVKVPAAHPRYILEPVACGVNMVMQNWDMLANRLHSGSKILILGTGFLAWVVYLTLVERSIFIPPDVTAIGNSNADIWEDVRQPTLPKLEYDIVFDLTGAFNSDMLRAGGILVAGTPTAQTSYDMEQHLLWNSITTFRPSPRASTFHASMMRALQLVENNRDTIDKFWTRGYDRDSEWKQAFSDSLNRPPGFSRAYIVWNNHLKGNNE